MIFSILKRILGQNKFYDLTVMKDVRKQSDTKISPYNMFEPLSRGGDDDPLPSIEDLQISGEPYPGQQLQACGFSINGTTSCNFEWVCHQEDGSVYSIDGATQPDYRVTADDVDSYLAVEVQPLDDTNRKGELVKVFANENRKIVCHPEMQSHIDKTLHIGHASYKVSLATAGTWKDATLSINRKSYSILSDNILVTAEKFSASTAVKIPFGQPAEFVMIGSDGSEHSLLAHYGSTAFSGSRDEIVLTLRLFSKRSKDLGSSTYILSSLQSCFGFSKKI